MARIAFFTLNAYDMLTGGHEGTAVGGAQLQQILVGTELADRGHDVYFVEYDEAETVERTVDGIEVVTKPRPTGSAPRRALSAFRGTRRVLNRIDPDVCYRRVLSFEILPVAAVCLLSDRRFVYSIAHDDELSDDPHKFASGIKSTRPYKALNRTALSSASAVIAQNDHQTALAREVLGTTVHQIPNCYPVDPAEPIDWEYEPPVALWAARFQPWKRPEVVAELAARVPEVTFLMAGSGDEDGRFGELRRRSESLDNLEVLGHVPFEEIDRYFAAADLFINTSDAEGFPNTFLQAWAQETPVVSLSVDPGRILQVTDIGRVADGFVDTLTEQVRTLANDPALRSDLGTRSRSYLRDHHSVEAIADRYEAVFLDD